MRVLDFFLALAGYERGECPRCKGTGSDTRDRWCWPCSGTGQQTYRKKEGPQR
jgi:DnaJ-class molecular chaperone